LDDKVKKLTLLAIVLTLSFTPTTSMAGKSDDTLNVTATVINTCRSINTDNIDFGKYDPTDPADNTMGRGSSTFRCTKGTSYRTYITRSDSMNSSTDSLSYELYSNPARSSVYPDAPVGALGTAANNGPITKDIYGTITALQNANPGNYAETITFTIEY